MIIKKILQLSLLIPFLLLASLYGHGPAIYNYGGDSSSVASELASGVSTIISATNYFAALKEDGSVVTWGDSDWRRDSSGVATELSSGVIEIFSNGGAFAALKEDDSVVTWGGVSPYYQQLN